MKSATRERAHRLLLLGIEVEGARAEGVDLEVALERCGRAAGPVRLAPIRIASTVRRAVARVEQAVARAELFRKAGGDIKLSGLSPYLHAIFRSAGGAGAFDFYAERQHAVSAF